MYFKHKSSTVRDWKYQALEHNGIDALREGSGILDVAGGKGELAWEFLNLNDVPAVVVEPRPLDFASCAGKFKYGIYWRNPIFRHYLHTPCESQRATHIPLHLRVMLEPSVIAWASGDKEPAVGGEEAFLSWSQKARSLQWTRQGLHESEDHEEASAVGQRAHQEVSCQCGTCDTALDQLDRGCEGLGKANHDADLTSAGDGELVSSASQALALLRGCSLVAALHPDQAAEHAVALALALGRPFAVVPCCVYAAEFPRRRLPGGAPVRTYDNLLDYLQGMDPRIRRENLDFEGKSTVLFMTADDLARPEPDSSLPHDREGTE